MKNIRTHFLIHSVLLPASTGVLLLLVFPPFSFWFVAFFAWLPILISLDGKSSMRALQSGGIAGVVFFGFLIYWLSYVTTLGYALLVFYLSLYPAVFCLIVTLLPRRFKRLPEAGPRPGLWEALQSGPVARPLWGGLIWACLEYLRGSGPFSFSWGLLGHSQANMPHLAHSAGWWGVYGLSFLLMAANLALAEFWRAHRRRVRPRNYWFWPFAVLILVALVGYGKPEKRHPVRPIRIALAQGNFSQEEKWDVPVGETLETYLRLSARALQDRPDLIVWPETAIPDVLDWHPDYRDRIAAWVKEHRTPILFGSVGEAGKDYLNSAFYVKPNRNGEVTWGRYDKVHLVPYGESVPFKRLFPFLKRMVEARGGGEYLPGTAMPLFEVNGTRFGVLICFESTLPSLARQYARSGADFLVVITNDAWFLKSTAPYQHAMQSAFRAIENGLPVARAANTGLTCAYNARGGRLAALPIYEESVLTVEIQAGRKRTPYSRWGDLPIHLALGVGLGYFAALFLLPRGVRS